MCSNQTSGIGLPWKVLRIQIVWKWKSFSECLYGIGRRAHGAIACKRSLHWDPAPPPEYAVDRWHCICTERKIAQSICWEYFPLQLQTVLFDRRWLLQLQPCPKFPTTEPVRWFHPQPVVDYSCIRPRTSRQNKDMSSYHLIMNSNYARFEAHFFVM